MARRPRTIPVLLLAALLATGLGTGLGTAPRATAAPTWLPAGVVGPPAASGEAGAVALDSAGDAVAVWSQADGGDPQVVASTRPAGGAWGAPVPLSLPGAASVGPQVVLGDDGRATAVWFRATGPGTYTVQSSSTSSLGGGWTAAADLPGGTYAAATAALVLRPGLSAVVAWPRNVAGQWYVSASVRTPGGTWGAPVDLSPGSAVMPGGPRLAVDGTGLTTAVWSRHDGTRWTVQAATLGLSGPWSPPAVVSPVGQDAVGPDLAVAANGTAVATWARWNGSDAWVAQSSTRPPSPAAWAAPVDLSGPGFSVGDVRVATNDLGDRAVVTWTATPASGPSVVQAAVHDPVAWRPPVTLSGDGSASSAPSAVVAGNGGATVAWLSGGPTHVVQGAVLPASATTFGPPLVLSPADRDAAAPRLADDRGGDVVAFWGDTGSTFQPRYAAYDVAGPALSTLHLAGHAVTGHPATYAAVALDAWSPVAAYSWSFGDGSTATKAAVTHTYAATGRYTVRLTVTDAAGNTTRRTSRTKVVAPPEITGFGLARRRISVADTARIRIGLSVSAKVKLVLRSKHRLPVGGALHRVKLVVKRDLPAGTSTVVVKGSRLRPDTWVVTGTARTLGVDSDTVKKRFLVVR